MREDPGPIYPPVEERAPSSSECSSKRATSTPPSTRWPSRIIRRAIGQVELPAGFGRILSVPLIAAVSERRGKNPHVEAAMIKDAAPGVREDPPIYASREGKPNLGRIIDPKRPVESLFRILSVPLGGLDAEGNLRLTKPMIAASRKVMREWRPGPDSRFRWLDQPLETARHGWLNRYGTPRDFIVRERQKYADQYEIMQQLAGILQGFVDVEMTAEEAQALQDVLEGKDLDSDKLKALAKPIREQLDSFGKELVDIWDVLSKEAYLRNLGRYLHRSYREYEFGAPPIVQWGRKKMRSRQSALHGDILKRRGRATASRSRG